MESAQGFFRAGSWTDLTRLLILGLALHNPFEKMPSLLCLNFTKIFSHNLIAHQYKCLMLILHVIIAALQVLYF